MTSINIPITKNMSSRIHAFFEEHGVFLVVFVLSVVSIISFWAYYQNGLGLAYNDARSHLDIGRRVVEGLKPGLAQLGSVWLPLTHLLMAPLIWNDFMWHSGLAGALWSMFGFVGTGVVIYLFLRRLRVGLLGRFVGVAVFAANLNVLYLQSTAMTELLLLFTMTTAAYFIMRWFQDDNIMYLIQGAAWIMLSTLVRYDGWFLLGFAGALVVFYVLFEKGFRPAEGTAVIFFTLGGFGILLWLLWNQLIFKDALYFIFGPYSAKAQQDQIDAAGLLATKGNVWFSAKVYFYALAYNSGALTVLMGFLGAVVLWFSKNLRFPTRISTFVLLAPLFFNILALYLGHSVLYVQGLTGDSLFNVRYGVMLMPSFAIFIGYLVSRAAPARFIIIGLLVFVAFFQFSSGDAVTIDDARVGSSQKNVTEVSAWLAENAADKEGFILVAAASHDAIIFSSGLPMKKFIHEGTGVYWESATESPDRWARWIVMRTYSEEDLTWRLVSRVPGFGAYDKVQSFPFADVYELRPEYLPELNTTPTLGKQK